MDPAAISLTTIRQIGPTGEYQGGAQGRTAPFDRGQIFQALVTSANRDGSFSLDLGNRLITANSDTPLQVGQQLRLAVTSTAPQITLQVLGSQLPQLLAKNMHLFGQQQELLPILQQLSQTAPLLENLSSESRETLAFFARPVLSAEKPEGAAIRQFIGDLGLTQERMLSQQEAANVQASLKSVLAELNASLPEGHRFGELAGKALQTLELFQLLQIRLADDGLLFFPLPPDFFSQGFLVEQEGRKQEKDQRNESERSYSLHLKLQGLGNLQVNLLQSGDRLNLQFLAEDQERASFLAEHREELTRRLTALHLEGVSFLAGARDPMQTILSSAYPEQTGLLDTKA